MFRVLADTGATSRSWKNDLLANSRSELLGGEAGAAGEGSEAPLRDKTSRLLMPHVFGAWVEQRASLTFHHAPAVAYKPTTLPFERSLSKRFSTAC